MYKFSIPEQDMARLWMLREHMAMGPIAKQVRGSVSAYLKEQEKRIGCDILEAAEAIERHDCEQTRNREQ